MNDRNPPKYVDGFNANEIEVVRREREEMLAKADHLRRAIANTRELGGMLTPDMVAQGRAIIETFDIRNQRPTFPPLFLTFLENQQWIRATDDAIVRMRKRLGQRASLFRHFVKSAMLQPMGGLFELNVFSALDDAFRPAEPQPRLIGSGRRGDIRITVDGISVYVEATVLGEGAFWDRVMERMWKAGLNVHGTSAPGPVHEADRIAMKIAEELKQTAPDAPNIIAISFFGSSPSGFARRLAFEDLASPTPTVAKDAGIDLTNLRRVDSIFECSRNHLTNVNVNPNCDPVFRLPDATREKIAATLRNPMMIR